MAAHPSRVRGLKQEQCDMTQIAHHIAPFTGAWIETTTASGAHVTAGIAPFTGAWIETSVC